MALLTEPNQTLKREDISDEITLVDARKCVFSTMVAKKGPPNNTLFEYPVDKNDDPELGGTPDGTDLTSGETGTGQENLAKLAARIQYWREGAGVGKVANTVPDVAGVGKGQSFNYAVQKKMTKLKRNMEFTYLSTQESAADNGTDGSLTRGIGKWIQSGAQSDQPVPAAYRPAAALVPTVATVAGVTETGLRALFEAMWTVIGSSEPTVCFCRSTFQKVITDFMDVETQSSTSLPLRRYTSDAGSGTIKMTVNRYVGDFGEAVFIPTTFMNNTNANLQLAYFLHMARWHTRNQQNPMQTELPDNGAGRRAMLDAINGLACANPIAEGKYSITP